jgi:hypothetical protein
MSLAGRVITMVGVARNVVGHPAVQVAISVAPLLLTPQVKQAAREVTLSAAYHAGVVARRIVKRG